MQAAYGLSFKAERSYQPTFMYRALTGGEADVISRLLLATAASRPTSW